MRNALAEAAQEHAIENLDVYDERCVVDPDIEAGGVQSQERLAVLVDRADREDHSVGLLLKGPDLDVHRIRSKGGAGERQADDRGKESGGLKDHFHSFFSHYGKVYCLCRP